MVAKWMQNFDASAGDRGIASQASGQAIEEVRTDSKPCPSGVVYRIEDDHSLHLYRGEVRIF